jgi:hypothetical protein
MPVNLPSECHGVVVVGRVGSEGSVDPPPLVGVVVDAVVVGVVTGGVVDALGSSTVVGGELEVVAVSSSGGVVVVEPELRRPLLSPPLSVVEPPWRIV